MLVLISVDLSEIIAIGAADFGVVNGEYVTVFIRHIFLFHITPPVDKVGRTRIKSAGFGEARLPGHLQVLKRLFRALQDQQPSINAFATEVIDRLYFE